MRTTVVEDGKCAMASPDVEPPSAASARSLGPQSMK
jgi:hypothetical protein